MALLTGGLYFKNKFRNSGAPSKPYFVPFQHCISESAKYCKPGIQINYYFDFNKEFKNYAVDLYSMLKNLAAAQRDPISKALGNIEFPTGLEAPALQTADLLAYQTYQYCKVRITNPRASIPSILRRLLSKAKNPRDFVFYDRKTLVLSLEDCPPSIRTTF